MPEGTLINGTYHDHNAVRITIDGEEIVGISEINYSDGTEPGEVFGTRQLMLGKTNGRYTAELSWTMNKRRHTEMLGRMGHGFYSRDHDVSVSYRDTDGLGLITDDIIGCRLTKNENSSSEGSDPVGVAVTSKPTVIVWNGVNPLDASNMGGLGAAT